MLKIRLRRVGAKKQPSYRLVVAESSSPRDGRFVENIGFYNPRTEPATVKVEEDRALYWLSQGAQPTDSVSRLFKISGTSGRFDRLKKGEDLQVLVQEAASEVPESPEVPAAEVEEVVEADAAPTVEEATAE
jgi:small subunit ribosomal protein S16